MISEFRSVLACEKPEDLVRDFQDAVNRSVQYMAEGLNRYKGWTPCFVSHAEVLQFGFYNMGYRNAMGKNASTYEGVWTQGFLHLMRALTSKERHLHLGYLSPDKNTAFVYAVSTNTVKDLIVKVLGCLADRIESRTLKVWAASSFNNGASDRQIRFERGDYDTPDLDDTDALAIQLGVSTDVAKELANFVYSLNMEEEGVKSALERAAWEYRDSDQINGYLDGILMEVMQVQGAYNNLNAYNNF